MTSADAHYQAPWEVAMGIADFPYDVSNLQLEAGPASAHTRLGWYRSVLNIPHQFAIASFLDELAHATQTDPRDFIRHTLGPDRVIDMNHAGLVGKVSAYGDFDAYPVNTGRLRRVLDVATEQAGWGRPLPRGQAHGLAVVRASASYLASVVQVAVAENGDVHIPRIDIAIDAGTIVHPDRVRAQMEGGTIMGLGNALVGQITFKHGRPEQSNFGDYRVLRMDAAPREMHVYIVPSTERSGGVGEPAVAPTIPAVCNAIFAATGRRIRTLPVGQSSSRRTPPANDHVNLRGDALLRTPAVVTYVDPEPTNSTGDWVIAEARIRARSPSSRSLPSSRDRTSPSRRRRWS